MQTGETWRTGAGFGCTGRTTHSAGIASGLFLVIGLAMGAPAAAQNCSIFTGGHHCNPGCPDECSFILCPDNLACSPRCGARPECSVLCGGDICAPGCPDECSFFLCPQNHCNCISQPQCDLLCDGDPCGSGCTDQCSAAVCAIPRCSNPNCDPCAVGCFCEPTCSTTFCHPVCNPGNALCNPTCGGDPCNFGCSLGPCGSGCPDECDPYVCSQSPCSAPPCGAAGQSACDFFIQGLHGISSCQSGTREAVKRRRGTHS